MSELPFEVGRIYNRAQIAEAFSTNDANIRNGVYNPKGTHLILLFVTEEQEDPRVPFYHDKLSGD